MLQGKIVWKVEYICVTYTITDAKSVVLICQRMLLTTLVYSTIPGCTWVFTWVPCPLWRECGCLRGCPVPCEGNVAASLNIHTTVCSQNLNCTKFPLIWREWQINILTKLYICGSYVLNIWCPRRWVSWESGSFWWWSWRYWGWFTLWCSMFCRFFLVLHSFEGEGVMCGWLSDFGGFVQLVLALGLEMKRFLALGWSQYCH